MLRVLVRCGLFKLTGSRLEWSWGIATAALAERRRAKIPDAADLEDAELVLGPPVVVFATRGAVNLTLKVSGRQGEKVHSPQLTWFWPHCGWLMPPIQPSCSSTMQDNWS